MTRQEYLIKEIEKQNEKIINILNNREQKDPEQIKKINFYGFLYSVDRLDPLTYHMILSQQLTNEEIKQLIKA